jgi:hypothetical protein
VTCNIRSELAGQEWFDERGSRFLGDQKAEPLDLHTPDWSAKIEEFEKDEIKMCLDNDY